MKNILVVGHKGKMGSAVCEELLKSGYNVFGKEKEDAFDTMPLPDLVVDFGGAKSSVESADWCKQNLIPLIVGSTGQSSSELDVIKNASTVVPVLMAGNFSIGVQMIKQMFGEIKGITIDDVCIFEKHHKNKRDSPSGTALELEECVKNQLGKQAQMLSLRGGNEIGTHTIDLYFGDELIEISHKAFSRKAFASGVVLAVKFMDKPLQPRIYKFLDVLN